jgi:hypothetical protein
MPISNATSSPAVKVPNQPEVHVRTFEIHVRDACRCGAVDIG